jgi:hypothetical protein
MFEHAPLFEWHLVQQNTFSFLHGQVLVAHLPRQLHVCPVVEPGE